jgi:hypothetical protein
MRDFCAPLRLEVGEQLEPPGVIGTVVRPAQRHDAVGVIAAALRAWRQVRGRDAPGLETHDAGAAGDLSRCACEAPNGAHRQVSASSLDCARAGRFISGRAASGREELVEMPGDRPCACGRV